MARSKSTDPKLDALHGSKTFNRHCTQVRDRLFLEQSFFDSRDLAQVKYEMLRRVQKEGAAVRETAAAFGFSRPTFYKAQDNFSREGLAGLIPLKRGPKRRRKLSAEIMDFVVQVRAQEPAVAGGALVDRVRERFGVTVHRRSLERALAAMKKKRPSKPIR
jgi:transposase